MGSESGRLTESALDRAFELLQQGEFAEAETIALQAIDEAPARAWFLIGAARHRQQCLEAALEAMQHALTLDPEMDEARRACAVLLLELKRPGEAWPLVDDLCKRWPGDAAAIADAGIVLEALGDAPAALTRYNEALRRDPRNFRAWLNRGALLARLGRLDEALRDNQLLVRGYAGSAAAHYNLADVLLRLDRYAEALAACERALRLAPASANILMLRGLTLAMLGRDEEARESIARARAVDGVAADRYRAAAASAAGLAIPQRLTLDPRQIRLARLLERQKACDWAERGRLLKEMRALAFELRQAPARLEEAGLYHTALSLPLRAPEQQALAQGIAQDVLVHAGAGVSSLAWQADRVRRRGKVRLGFISPNFRDHPSAQINWRQFALRDRNRFEVFAYSLRQGEGTLRRRIEEHCDSFREVSGLASREIADRIARDGIDILVDLAGHMDFSRPEILALRPAPLQVSYLGFPGTMGAELIDYRITDARTTPPEEQPFWSEKLALLPDTAYLYNDQEEIAAGKTNRLACGLPEQGFVFCCFNASYKIEPNVFATWMRLLERIPGSVLWLLDGGDTVRRHLKREAAVHGVAPERLVFAPRLPREEHLSRHALANIFLDTWYCGAMATAADALWAGLPVLTSPGDTMASRMGLSIVLAAGLPELVAPDHEAYEEAAFRLATCPVELTMLRTRLAQNRASCALFATARRVRELDQAFLMMWERHLAGLPPESFAVPPLEEQGEMAG